ncbi:MAG: hypothetical protein ACK52I_17450 [Pseudomonadota bacterium]|jgi:hypothetical protein
MIRLALILIAIALASSVGQCGEVYVERDASGRPVTLVHNGPSTELAKFLNDNADSLQTVETVRLLQHNVDADEIESLNKLNSLRNLELGDHPDEVKIAPEALSKIAALSTIEQLSVFATGKEENFGWLDSLPMLRSLTLSSDKLYSKEIFPQIGRLHDLESLSIRCSFPVEDFRWLGALTNLEHIDIHAKVIRTGDISALADLKELKSLAISGHALSNKQVMAISKHIGQRLDFLSICVDGDCTIEALSGFYNLNKLVVQHAGTSDRRQRVVDTNFVLAIPGSK